MSGFETALSRARQNSGFLARLMDQNAAITALLAAGDVHAALAAAKTAGAGASGTGQALRRERNALALVTAVADLAGAWDLTRVMELLSDFADQALDAAIRTAFAERVPDAEPRGFAVIA